MPKPILSDSLFNADDVATAILNEANLQIASGSLGVSDVSDHFTWTKFFTDSQYQTGRAHKFLNFIIFNYRGGEQFSSLGNYDTIGTMQPGVRPTRDMSFNHTSHQGESSNTVIFQSNGEIKLDTPYDPGDSAYRLTLEGIYYIDN